MSVLNVLVKQTFVWVCENWNDCSDISINIIHKTTHIFLIKKKFYFTYFSILTSLPKPTSKTSPLWWKYDLPTVLYQRNRHRYIRKKIISAQGYCHGWYNVQSEQISLIVSLIYWLSLSHSVFFPLAGRSRGKNLIWHFLLQVALLWREINL